MRRRDEADFTEFATAAIRRLRRTAYLMCGDWHRAEDAAQDALVRIYRRWDKLNHENGIDAYAHRAVVSTVLDQAKRPWRREHVAENLPDPPGTDSTSSVDQRMQVVTALAQLPDGQRACVVLRHYADLSIEDTAEALCISPGAVKSQSSRGIAQLRQLLASTERIPT